MDGPASGEVLRFEGFQFDRAAACLFRENGTGSAELLTLGSRAIALLGLLLDRRGKLVTKDEIFAAVWPGTTVEEANLAVQISGLRRILDRNRNEGSCIQTVPGRGYRFASPVTRLEPAARSPAFAAYGSDGSIADPKYLEGRGALDQPRIIPAAGPRNHHQLLRRVMAMLTGAVVLFAVIVGVSWRLPWSDQTHLAPRLSIVVLPFTDLSGDPSQQYFADGLTDEVTTTLSRIKSSFVISRNTAFTYRNRPVNIKQIGHELGVRYVLEGSVQRSGGHVRVNAQLIDAGTDAHLWVERFDHDTTDPLAVEDEITRRLAIELGGELVRQEVARPSEHPDALDYILRGRAARFKPNSRSSYGEAIDMYERALVIDPQSAMALSYLAIALVQRAMDNMATAPGIDIARAELLARQAFAVSPRDPLTHWARGEVLHAQHRCEEAIPEYEMVLAVNRNLAPILNAMAICKLYTGSMGEVIPLEEQAIRLSPRDPQIAIRYFTISKVYLLQSQTDEAIEWLKRARTANPELSRVHAYLASAYALNGETERAATELAEARKLGASYSSIASLRKGYWGMPKIRALHEATLFVGLREAGVPEEE